MKWKRSDQLTTVAETKLGCSIVTLSCTDIGLRVVVMIGVEGKESLAALAFNFLS